MLMRWLQDWEWGESGKIASGEEPATWLESENFEPYLEVREGGGTEAEVQARGQWFNQSGLGNKTSVENLWTMRFAEASLLVNISM